MFDRIARFATHWLLARWLGPAGLGVYTAAMTVAIMASSIAQLGLPTGAIYFGARQRQQGDHGSLKGTVVSGLVISCISGCAGTAVLMAIAWWAPQYLKDPTAAGAIVFAAPIALVRPLMRFAVGMIQAAKDMRGMSRALYFAMPASLLVLSAAAVFAGLGVTGAVVAAVASFAVALAVALQRMWQLYAHALTDASAAMKLQVGALLRYSAPLSLADLVYRLNQWMDLLMLAALAAVADVGQYRVAVGIALLGAIPPNAIKTMFKPMVAELVHNNEIERLDDLLAMVTRWVLVIAAPIYVAVLIVPDFFLWIFGEEYLIGATAMVILMVGQVANVACSPLATILPMAGYTRIELANGVLAVTVNIVLNALLIPHYGIIGAATANAVALTLWSAARAIEVRWLVGVFGFSWRLAATMAPLVVTAIAAQVATQGTSLWVRLPTTAGILVAFLAAFWLFGRTDDDAMVIDRIRSKIMRRLRR